MPLTPTNYLNSVIYKIEHENKPELLYIGSTTNFIKRKYNHKLNCNDEKKKEYNFKLYQMIRDNGNWEAFKIMVIKNYPCNNKIELIIEEERHRKEFQATLNSCKAYRTKEEEKEYFKEYNKEYYEATKEERKEYKKEYYEENKDKLKEQMKEYRENNKEQKKEYDKEYREANKEHRKEQKKEYYEANKEKIKEQQKEKINCLCGSIFCKSDKAKHEKTEKHKIFINSLLLK